MTKTKKRERNKEKSQAAATATTITRQGPVVDEKTNTHCTIPHCLPRTLHTGAGTAASRGHYHPPERHCSTPPVNKRAPQTADKIQLYFLGERVAGKSGLHL
ncbi:hypothetical protein E2C01_092253 [Portunus trituberculatus]|uniref:Uncharacterized protein n=1 Tax=Portunus trituberculatus TaxID=210409 RepID=A0A5B7JVB1_PORTR|nr:hypothetical protein [Portunus trituberculatus]